MAYEEKTKKYESLKCPTVKQKIMMMVKREKNNQQGKMHFYNHSKSMWTHQVSKSMRMV